MENKKSNKRTSEIEKIGKKKKDKEIYEEELKEDEETHDICEDPWEDELEDEEVHFDEDDNEITEEMDFEELSRREKEKLEKHLKEDEETNENLNVYTPGIDKLDEGEVLDYDPSAYIMLHRMHVEWPCLSFDIVPDKLGAARTRFPHSMYLVAGSQTNEKNFNQNKIYIMKISELSQMEKESDDEDDEDEDEDGTDDDPVVEQRFLHHIGDVNRIRVMSQEPYFAASWSSNGCVYIWDIYQHLKALDNASTSKPKLKPLSTLTGHKTEGFAMNWSLLNTGRIITGDCDKHIFVANMTDSGAWVQDTIPFIGHTSSVEDLQWSPTEPEVFASCSVDKTIRIWDGRMKVSALSFEAANCDVNVISWNKKVTYLLASGADDGTFRIWDLRSLKSNNKCDSIANFKWHTDQITSIEWDPFDESSLCVSSSDGQTTIWDLSVEKDTESTESDVSHVPPQLMFSHQGQKDVKEAHFHNQIPGVIISTADDGFNFWKPAIEVEQK
jgi:ribosome assembly protein RRB1